MSIRIRSIAPNIIRNTSIIYEHYEVHNRSVDIGVQQLEDEEQIRQPECN